MLWQFAQFRLHTDACRSPFTASQLGDSYRALPKPLLPCLHLLGHCPRPSGRGFGGPKRMLRRLHNFGGAGCFATPFQCSVFQPPETVFGSCFSVGGGVFCDGRRRFSCFVLKFLFVVDATLQASLRCHGSIAHSVVVDFFHRPRTSLLTTDVSLPRPFASFGQLRSMV